MSPRREDLRPSPVRGEAIPRHRGRETGSRFSESTLATGTESLSKLRWFLPQISDLDSRKKANDWAEVDVQGCSSQCRRSRESIVHTPDGRGALSSRWPRADPRAARGAGKVPVSGGNGASRRGGRWGPERQSLRGESRVCAPLRARSGVRARRPGQPRANGDRLTGRGRRAIPRGLLRPTRSVCYN